MKFSRSDLADLSYFLVIARHRSFRLAGLELGVSASALSHALRGLEKRLGVRLLNRTSRSVMLTAAGEELRAGIDGPFDAIGRSFERLDRFRDKPAGRIRLNAMEEAADLLLGPVLPAFADRYPDVEIEIAGSNRMEDVIGSGFDAGIRYGGTVPEDMIAQRISADIRWVVVGSPSYFERFGEPRHPHDLLSHRCVKIRLGDDRIYRWEFTRAGEALEILVPGSITVDRARAGLAAVKGGAGLIYVPEPLAASFMQETSLRAVLTDWAPVGPAYYIYYSSQRHVPTGLRAFIKLIRELQPLGL